MVDIIITEANSTYWSGYGGGPQAATLEETSSDYSAKGGGGLAEIGLTELPPLYPAPQVTTGPVMEMGLESAALSGILDDDGGMNCECWFEWGLNTSYGNVTPSVSKTTGEKYLHALDGLLSGITYHFRAVASNIFGTSHGIDKAFRTPTTVTPPYFQNPLVLLLAESEEAV